MRKNRLASLSVAAATTILTLGGAGCGDLQDIADELLSHNGGGSGGSGGSAGSGGSGGSAGSTGQGCDYQGKTYDFGSSFPSVDGCNVCTCDKTGVACTEKSCSDAGTSDPATSCEKVPVTAASGECVPFDQVKIQSSDICVQRGETLNSLELGAPCDDGASTREAFVVCCKTAPANDIACAASAGADGAPCTVCTDASGAVVKTDCLPEK